MYLTIYTVTPCYSQWLTACLRSTGSAILLMTRQHISSLATVSSCHRRATSKVPALGPTLFCLAVRQLLLACKSPLKIAYMDDITLGGPSTDVAADVAMIKAEGPSHGLCLNESKCEAITTSGQSSIDLLQEFIQLTPSSATLLGAPLMVDQVMDECLGKRRGELERAITRLELITSHDALVLIRSSFSAPKVQHTLRASPCFGHRSLLKFDQLLRDGLRKICNISLTEDQWLQASLPVRSGGLKIRRVSSLAIPAFLASAVGTRDL